MTQIELNDAFLNCGLPQMTNKSDFSKNEIREIIAQVKDFDNYYISGWKESKTRQTLKEFVNDYCSLFRWYSLSID